MQSTPLKNLMLSLTLLTTAIYGDFYVIPIKPKTGKVWLDRNLGSTQVCTAYNDEQCYGDYYQSGRYADGHEKFGSEATTTLSASLLPGHGDFIASTSSSNWTEGGVDDNGSLRSANWNPCPPGYRIPLEEELKITGTNNVNNGDK
ncbi:MAG: hypothetical protein JXK05_07480 [Campylobacterales bacterium]|nr:hypothetical protein [Campylobacterales bacterium]